MNGWKLVPVELTEAQNVAGIFAACQIGNVSGLQEQDERRKAIYRAQIAAAPAPEVEPVGDITIGHFRGHLENRDFDYYGSLPDGTYKLYTHPASDELVKAVENVLQILENPMAIQLTRAQLARRLRSALDKVKS